MIMSIMSILRMMIIMSGECNAAYGCGSGVCESAYDRSIDRGMVEKAIYKVGLMVRIAGGTPNRSLPLVVEERLTCLGVDMFSHETDCTSSIKQSLGSLVCGVTEP